MGLMIFITQGVQKVPMHPLEIGYS